MVRVFPERARAAGAVAAALLWAFAGPAGAATASSVGSFSYGELSDATVGAAGCGTNSAAEPGIRVSPTGDVFLGSELGSPAGSELWRGLQGAGGGGSGCSLEYRGSPNGPTKGGAGGDLDLAIAPQTSGAGTRTVYVASLNAGSVTVARSYDDGTTFTVTPVVEGLPLDDREWIAAYGPVTSLLTYTDVTTGDIDVLRSTDGGQSYSQVSQAIPLTDYRAMVHTAGNLAIDPRSGTAYQSFAAQSDPSGAFNNEFFVAVSTDKGSSWTIRPVGCSVASTGIDHIFPNVAVDPASGRVWVAWSDDTRVYTATSTDGGASWSCSGPVSAGNAQAILPWIAARDGGADLVYYGTPSGHANGNWYVYFLQDQSDQPGGWSAPQQLMPVHDGTVCENGASCTSRRQLFEDFGVDVDPGGLAHIAYSHDAPDLGGAGSYTGYAVQTGGPRLGASGSSPGLGGAGASPTGATKPGRPHAACTASRWVAIAIHHPRGSRVVRVAVYVNGKLIRVRRRGLSHVRVLLRSRSDIVHVRLVVRYIRRRRTRSMTVRRTYRLCGAPPKRGR